MVVRSIFEAILYLLFPSVWHVELKTKDPNIAQDFQDRTMITRCFYLVIRPWKTWLFALAFCNLWCHFLSYDVCQQFLHTRDFSGLTNGGPMKGARSILSFQLWFKCRQHFSICHILIFSNSYTISFWNMTSTFGVKYNRSCSTNVREANSFSKSSNTSLFGCRSVQSDASVSSKTGCHRAGLQWQLHQQSNSYSCSCKSCSIEQQLCFVLIVLFRAMLRS